MIFAVVEMLTSRAKWAKVGILIQERWLVSLHGLRKLADGRRSVAREEGVVEAGTEYAVRSDHEQWDYTSQVSMPEALLEGEGTRFRQDQKLPDGRLQATYQYQSAIYHEASFCSNGVTHVSVFDRHDRRVPEFSYAKYGKVVPVSRHLDIDRYVPGTTLSLYGNVENTAGNIGHWMIDGLARLFLALRHHDLTSIDHVLVPKLKYGFQRESLLELGIPSHKIVEIDVLECVRCERLIVTTAPRGFSSSNTPGWLIDGFRQALLPAKGAVAAGKRIYISRRDAGSRKFVNEEEIIACLEKFGFEPVEMSSYDFNDKIALFAQAEMIVGLTGAGLTNLMLCRSDACVLELFPASYVTYFYTSIACYLGMDYQYLVFDNDSVLSSMNRYYGNLSLDTDMLADRISSIVDHQKSLKTG
ncbi:glycosyltransferase family 61 protein [Granulosicoccus sp. 3-233]|uniref:glycosyltransferase family 61 protein n=1 Tax=Granulosicoccus sp. 3-233 TaxID=3417969 RepID=UPI003D3253BC